MSLEKYLLTTTDELDNCFIGTRFWNVKCFSLKESHYSDIRFLSAILFFTRNIHTIVSSLSHRISTNTSERFQYRNVRRSLISFTWWKHTKVNWINGQLMLLSDMWYVYHLPARFFSSKRVLFLFMTLSLALWLVFAKENQLPSHQSEIVDVSSEQNTHYSELLMATGNVFENERNTNEMFNLSNLLDNVYPSDSS